MNGLFRILTAAIVLLCLPTVVEAGTGHPAVPVQGSIQVTPGWLVTEIRVSYTDPNGIAQSHAYTVNNHLKAQEIKDAKAAAASGLGVTVWLDKIPNRKGGYLYEYFTWMQHLPAKSGSGPAPTPK